MTMREASVITQHLWTKSTLGHGSLMCKICGCTDREAIFAGIKCVEYSIKIGKQGALIDRKVIKIEDYKAKIGKISMKESE
jgi:hypothetical protein